MRIVIPVVDGVIPWGELVLWRELILSLCEEFMMLWGEWIPWDDLIL